MENVGIILQSPSFEKTKRRARNVLEVALPGATRASLTSRFNPKLQNKKNKQTNKQKSKTATKIGRTKKTRVQKRRRTGKMPLLFQKSLGPSHKCVSEGKQSNF